jgi:SAM-dependent methyltransferase
MLSDHEPQYWDVVANLWNQTSPQTLWRAHADAINIMLLAHWLPEDRATYLLKTDVFDEAFGDGLYPFLKSKADQIVGIDLSISALYAAQSPHTGLQGLNADVRWLPFADGVFDVIVSNSTLDHFVSQTGIVTSLYEFYRILREGGQLILTLDNLANPIIALRNVLPFRLLHGLGIVPYFVGVTYGPQRLRRTLQQVGFEVHEVGAVMHCQRIFTVALAHILEKHATTKTQIRFLGFLRAFERLSSWPTRFLTGHFVAVKAIKP